jgi:hypothetical protein
MGLFLQIVLLAILMFYPAWRIFERTGFPPALALLVLIPGVGILVALGILAFAEWPVHRYGQDITGGGET